MLNYEEEHALNAISKKSTSRFLQWSAFYPIVVGILYVLEMIILLSMRDPEFYAGTEGYGGPCTVWDTIKGHDISELFKEQYWTSVTFGIILALFLCASHVATFMHNKRNEYVLYSGILGWIVMIIGCASPLLIVAATLVVHDHKWEGETENSNIHYLFAHAGFGIFFVHELLNTVLFAFSLCKRESDSRRTRGNFTLLGYWILTLVGGFVCYKLWVYYRKDENKVVDWTKGCPSSCSHWEWASVFFIWIYYLGFSYVSYDLRDGVNQKPCDKIDAELEDELL